MYQSKLAKNISVIVIGLAFVGFVYLVGKATMIVNKKYISTSDGLYHSYISTSQEIAHKAKELTQGCENQYCQTQALLDYVTHIPYRSKTYQQYKPHETMAQNFGDCDDKSNLLISLLHVLDIEAYFVLVPKHIFVIVALDDARLADKKGLVVEGKKYYILESTATGSKIGYGLHYKRSQIEAIIEPFSNTTLSLDNLAWR